MVSLRLRYAVRATTRSLAKCAVVYSGGVLQVFFPEVSASVVADPQNLQHTPLPQKLVLCTNMGHQPDLSIT